MNQTNTPKENTTQSKPHFPGRASWGAIESGASGLRPLVLVLVLKCTAIFEDEDEDDFRCWFHFQSNPAPSLPENAG